MPTQEKSDLMRKLEVEREAGEELQERKHDDWDDNYKLYRGKVETNRLTQRQVANIPLMKETIKTSLSKIDDAPNIEYMELGGDEDKEIIYQEIWDSNYRDQNLELEDVMDKKNVLLYGLSSKMLNIDKKGISITVLDPYDIVFDPLMRAGKIETARFFLHKNIYRPIRDILADPKYSKEGKSKLKVFEESPEGMNSSDENRKAWEEKMARLQAMGVSHQDFQLYAGGDRLINLTQHFTTLWNKKTKRFERRVIVYAENFIELLNLSLMEAIGMKRWPITTWVEDPETTDIYSDSVADLVRIPNKIINVWFSQLIENRTLKNFQMHWFSPIQGYKPQTYTPGPGVMLPAPAGEDINKVIKPVEISGLEDTMEAINALTLIVERGTATTAIDKGQAEKGAQTLGEVEILVGKSQERAVGMAKFYRNSWYELCDKWNEMMHANSPRVLKLYKKGNSGKVYEKKALASDWKSDVGYRPIVSSTSEQEQNNIQTIQKFNFVLGQFPNNPALRKIAQKRQLEILDLTPEELKEIEEAEDGAPQQITPQQQQPQAEAPALPQAPVAQPA